MSDISITANPVTNPVIKNPFNLNGTAKNVNSDGTATTNNSLSNKNQFLTLLVEELKNQDPTAPTDEKQTLSQLAQFSSLEQMQNLNQTLTASSGFGQVAQSAALIGKTISTATVDTTGISGVVSSVTFLNGKSYLHVGSQDIDASTVTTVSQ